MAKRKIDNSLYHFLLGAVSNALPLEFAIRASELRHAVALTRLKDIDKEVRDCLLSWGAREEEIDAEELIDHAWDILQTDTSHLRTHGRLLHSEIMEIMKRSGREIRSKMNIKSADLALPAARYFRICDLLKGNDIEKLLLTSEACLLVAKEYGRNDDIELHNFAPLQEIRQPIHLHPSFGVRTASAEDGESFLCLFVKANAFFDELDIERQVGEFLFQLALIRERQAHPKKDAVADALFNKFLEKDVAGDLSENVVTRLDGLAAVLAGLYCRDLCKRKGMQLEAAKQATLQIYKKSEDAVAKNYKLVTAQINKSVEKFEG